jgi:hypothetical protein
MMMMANTTSPDVKKNTSFKKVPAKRDEGNREWLKRIIKENEFDASGLLLIGGNSMVDFRIRVAQSHLRHDLTPSYWSMVGILSGKEESFFSVPLQWTGELSEMPHSNGIMRCPMADYDDPVHFPNIAFVQFTRNHEDILKYADRLRWQRSVIDLPTLVVAWLKYVWAVGDGSNPLVTGYGLPSAVFAEMAYGIGGIELTPGLASASSCPEAIWQAAKWWRSFYEETSQIDSGTQARHIIPQGCFALRQPAASIYEKPYVPPEKEAVETEKSAGGGRETAKATGKTTKAAGKTAKEKSVK